MRYGGALASLRLAHARCTHQRAALLDDPATAPHVPEALEAWHAWRVCPRRMTAYLERLAQGKEGTGAEVPEELHGLFEVLREEKML